MLPLPLSFLINLFSNYRPRTAASGRGSRESHKAYSKCSAFTTSAWPLKTKALNSSEIHPSVFLWLQCLALAPWKRSESVFCLIPCQSGVHSCILQLGISRLTYTALYFPHLWLLNSQSWLCISQWLHCVTLAALDHKCVFFFSFLELVICILHFKL